MHRFLGLSVAAVQSNMATEAGQAAYKCDITYVTGQELCFNYLRDNTALSGSELVGAGAGVGVVRSILC